ncbi:MAG TPA: hypothetical protein VEV13_01465 [Candidatus Limnocylindria bacterium]|nr:hypothetical protein [Candidatus Limnocylindria bacterium]
MTTHKPAEAHARLRPTLPTPSMVTLLQAIESYPAVTLLMSTTPAARMLPEEAERLLGMAREAEVRLTSESLPGIRGTVLRPLAELAEEAGRGPATEAIAVFVSAATRAVVHLNLLVADRVVVDPTFATRDLVRALHRTPRHVVLTLSQHEARLFEGAGGDLHPAPGRSFPRVAAGAEAARRGERGMRVQERKSFYRDVDRALGAYLRVHPAPLVLVGTERELAEFRGLSANLGRLAGCVHGSLVTAPTSDLVPRIRLVMEGYLRSRQQEALALLEERASAKRAVSGIASAWLAAQAERPEMLAVEEGYFYPARVDGSGELLSPADDVEHPDVIDDAVDELIETVLRRGGWVALVEDGALVGHERVALTLRK